MPYYRELRQPYPNELYHHGIKGQKWGVRRFQNPDGTFTEAGKKRYAYTGRGTRNLYKDVKKQHREEERFYTSSSDIYKGTLKEEALAEKRLNRFKSRYGIDDSTDRQKMSKKVQQKLDRHEANAKDARENRRTWESINDEAVKEMKKTTRDLNKLITERGKTPLKDVPTKTLDNGKEIVNGKVFTAGEMAKGWALTLASVAAGVVTANAIGSPVAFYQDFVPSREKHARDLRARVEKEAGYDRFKNYNNYRYRKKQGYYK